MQMSKISTRRVRVWPARMLPGTDKCTGKGFATPYIISAVFLVVILTAVLCVRMQNAWYVKCHANG